AHDAGRLIERHVQLIRHQLAKCRARSLTEICFSHVERCRIVLMNHDPRIELAKVEIGVGSASLWRCCLGSRHTLQWTRTQTHEQQSGGLPEISAGCLRAVPVQHFLDLSGNIRKGCHATTSFFEPVPMPAINFAARLIAAWTR